MIIKLLLNQFDIFKYKNLKIIKSHFPIHHFRYRSYIQMFWKKYFYFTLIEALSPVRIERGLQPLKQIAFYHGVQNGFYFGFLVTFTSYLIPLSMYGIGAYIYGLYQGENDLNRTILPFTSLITSIWMSIFFEMWKRRETLLAYNFGVLGTSENEEERKDHNGEYYVSKITGEVVRENKFDSFKRRLIFELPIFLIGVGVVLTTAFLFQRWNDTVEAKNTDGDYKEWEYTALTTILGSGQGLVIVILNTLYSYVVKGIVYWENHK